MNLFYDELDFDESKQVGLYWDYKNASTKAKGINVPLAEWILALAKTFGIPFRMNVYATWEDVSSMVRQGLYSMGFDLKDIPIRKTNSEDAMIIVDALSDAFETDVDVYFLITADKDFIPLINKLKKLGKYVYVIGSAPQASELLIQSCDQFISVEELKKRYNEELRDKETERSIFVSYDTAIKSLKDAVKTCEHEGKARRYSVIDTIMRSDDRYDYYGYKSIEINPPFSSFSKFIEKAESDGYIKTGSVGDFMEIFNVDEELDEVTEFAASGNSIPKAIKQEYARLIPEIYQILIHELKWDYIKFSMYSHNARKELKKRGIHISGSVSRAILAELVNEDIIGSDSDNKLIIYDDHFERVNTYFELN